MGAKEVLCIEIGAKENKTRASPKKHQTTILVIRSPRIEDGNEAEAILKPSDDAQR
jgi:hypothetical protein